MLGLGLGLHRGIFKSAVSYVSNLIKAFKARIILDSGIFEAQNCLKTTLTNLDSLELLTKASLIVTPNAYKAGELYSVIPNTTLGDLDVVRATTATRVNSAGLIESVAINVPRIDYTNGSCPSLLVEPQRTNRLLNSETVVTQTIATTGVACTVSFYGTGTITFSGSYIGSLVGTGVNNRVALTFTPTVGSLILTVVGSCTKGQLETGSYATSYIPTTSTTVTRNADVISKTNSFIANKTVACLFIDLNRYYYASDFVGILGYRNASTCDFYMLQYQNSDVIEFRAKSANGVQNSINLNVPLGHSKIAMYRENDKLSIFINGIKIIEQTSTSPMNEFLNSPQLLRINIDPFFGTYDAQLFINSAQIYTTILSDTECINLTTL